MINQGNQNVQSTETSRAEIVTYKRIDSTDKLKPFWETNLDVALQFKYKDYNRKVECEVSDDASVLDNIISFDVRVEPEVEASSSALKFPEQGSSNIMRPQGEASSSTERPRGMESSRTGGRSTSRELCQDRIISLEVKVLEKPFPRYRGDIDGLEKAISKEYKRRLFFETPKYFFTHEHMKYLMDEQYFPGMGDNCMQNLEISAKPLLDLIREILPEKYESFYGICEETSVLFFPVLLNEAPFSYEDETGMQEDHGRFVMRLQEHAIIFRNKLFIQCNSLKSLVFCIFAVYVYLDAPRPPKLSKTLSFLEELLLKKYILNKNEAKIYIKKILQEINNPEE